MSETVAWDDDEFEKLMGEIDACVPSLSHSRPSDVNEGDGATVVFDPAPTVLKVKLTETAAWVADLTEGAAWLEDGRRLRGAYVNTLAPSADKMWQTEPGAAWIAEALDCKYGIDVGFLCMVAIRYEIPIPTPSSFLPFRELSVLSSSNQAARQHRFPKVVSHLRAVRELKDEGSLCMIGYGAMDAVAARIVVSALLDDDDYFLQAFAKVLLTIPSIGARASASFDSKSIDKKRPSWYKVEQPFSTFFAMCTQAMAWTDWRYHPYLILSAEMKHIYDAHWRQ